MVLNILIKLICVATFVFTHRINIEWKGLSEIICRKTKNDLIKRIPASVVGGQRNCIKHIWGMEPVWLMDVGYDIVLEDSAARPLDGTAGQTSANHYRLIMEHSWSGPWGGGRGGRHARENKEDEHCKWWLRSPWSYITILTEGMDVEAWQVSASTAAHQVKNESEFLLHTHIFTN